MGFKYRYADIACEYCLNKGRCKHEICPHIMENLDDLMSDKAFQQAITDAEECTSKHKRTLLQLKKEQQSKNEAADRGGFFVKEANA